MCISLSLLSLCVSQGCLDPASSHIYHMQVEGLPPCCTGGAPAETGDSIVPLGGAPVPERLRLLPRDDRLVKVTERERRQRVAYNEGSSGGRVASRQRET